MYKDVFLPNFCLFPNKISLYRHARDTYRYAALDKERITMYEYMSSWSGESKSFSNPFDDLKTSSEDEKDDDGIFDDLDDAWVMVKKLQDLLKCALGKIEKNPGNKEGKVDRRRLRLASLAYLQLCTQVKGKHAEKRDIMCAISGPAQDAKDMKGVKMALNFADWAYETETDALRKQLESINFSLLKHDKTKKVGCVGHYVAIKPEDKTAVIGVKGSSSLEDGLTDIYANTVYRKLDGAFVKDGCSEIRAHEGIYASAKNLADDVQLLVKSLFVPLNYRILVCGHSLGAGTATLLAPILRSRISALMNNDSIEVICFACPPVLDHDSALACAPFTTSIVNNSDVIPRCSLANFEVFVACCSALYKKIQEKEGIHEKESFRSSKIFQSSRFLKKIAMEEDLLSIKEIEEIIDQAQKSVAINDPGHLYVPGCVIFIYETWGDAAKLEDNVELDEIEVSIRGIANAGKEIITSTGNNSIIVAMTYGTSKPLRFIEIDKRMVSDHYIDSYHKCVDTILQQKGI